MKALLYDYDFETREKYMQFLTSMFARYMHVYIIYMF